MNFENVWALEVMHSDGTSWIYECALGDGPDMMQNALADVKALQAREQQEIIMIVKEREVSGHTMNTPLSVAKFALAMHEAGKAPDQ